MNAINTEFAKPLIELKKINCHTGLSQETFAYTAQIWVDGRHFGDVMNEGHGGCDMVYPPRGRSQNEPKFYEELKALEARIAATYEPHVYVETTIEASLEGICSDLVGKHLTERDAKRAISRKVLFIAPDKRGVRYFQKVKPTADVLAKLQAKYPQYKFLNAMPIDEAVALYISQAE